MKGLFLFLLMSPAAFGQLVTLNYTGAPMTGQLEFNAGPYDFTQITGTLTLGAPLDPNMANQYIQPHDFNFGGFLITQCCQQRHFTFSTQNGVITAWDIELSFSDSNGTSVTLSLTSQGDSYTYGFSDPGCMGAPGPCITHWTASNTVAGSWADPPAPVNQLQAQLTHATSEMQFYRQGVVNWEAQALAWQAKAKECQLKKGVC